MQVSVVITTKNEEKNIQNCLDSILKQTFSREEMEIIVADNNSTDRTKEVARQCTNNIFDDGLAPLNLEVFNWGPERSAQRNFGVGKAMGEYILYLDADMILSPGVINECVEKIREDDTLVALYIPEIIMGEGLLSRVRGFERSFYDGTVIDAVRFVKRDVFTGVGGFDESLTGPEDWDFDRKIREIGKVDIIASPLYHNERHLNLKNYLNKKAYYSQNFQKYINKWGAQDTNIRKQFGLYYRYFGVFLEQGKWKKVVSHPILACGMLCLRFLVGVNYLLRK